MNNLKHTPGPWGVVPRESANHIGPDAQRAREFDVCTTPQNETGRANARLIAAAPDLLEAIKLLMSAVPDSKSEPLKSALANAVLVIEEATGGSK